MSIGSENTATLAYLLDTNAIQGIGRQALLAAREAGHRLLLSPMSFWELACHLDEENFQLARGNARKALLCEVLHDPIAEIMIDVGCPGVVHPGRFDDQAGAQAIVAELEQVHSYVDLMERQALLGGHPQRIGHVAEQLRNVLDQERQTFVTGMHTRCHDYVARLGRARAITLGGREFCELAAGLAHTLLDVAVQGNCNVTFGQILDRTLLGAGYGVARACAYIASVGEGQDLPIDGNDMEDYHICLHLGVSADRTFVTNDDGVRTALNRAILAFQDFATASGHVFATNARIITPDEFRTETGHHQ